MSEVRRGSTEDALDSGELHRLRPALVFQEARWRSAVPAPDTAFWITPKTRLGRLLRSVACADHLVAASATKTAYAAEKCMGKTGMSSRSGGPSTPGHVDKVRSGQVVVSERVLDRWEAHFPSLSAVRRSILWALMVDGRNHAENERLIEAADDETFWVSFSCLMPPLAVRKLAFPFVHGSSTMRKLALSGRPDAVAILWVQILRASQRSPDSRHLMLPAFALLSRFPGFQRVSYLLFALTRREILSQGHCASEPFPKVPDLESLAERAPLRPNFSAEQAPPHKQGAYKASLRAGREWLAEVRAMQLDAHFNARWARQSTADRVLRDGNWHPKAVSVFKQDLFT